MAYNIIISERANEQIDTIVGYVKNTLNSPAAATSILLDIEDSYDKLEHMAEAFGYCNDNYLRSKGYRKKLLARHNYLIIYRIVNQEVHVSGIFHIKEDYASKL